MTNGLRRKSDCRVKERRPIIGATKGSEVSKNMKITKRSHRFPINIGNFDFGFDQKVLPDGHYPTHLCQGFGAASLIKVNPTKSDPPSLKTTARQAESNQKIVLTRLSAPTESDRIKPNPTKIELAVLRLSGRKSAFQLSRMGDLWQDSRP